jgi:penicillin G amidase
MRLFLRISLFFIILFAGMAAIGIYWTFYKPLPNYSATLTISGLNESVDVHWDSFGVPYIHAGNDHDLYFTVGYVHAQERLWQMTLTQLAAEGRFAEFFGEDLVEIDKFQRTIGFWDTAKKIQDQSDPALLTVLQSYADGVNAYINSNRRNLPVEFTLLSMEPLEWEVTHTFALMRLMAWDQNIHWWSELVYAFLGEKLEPQRLQELFPVYSDRYPTTLSDAQSRALASSMLPLIETEFSRRKLLSVEGAQIGSNAWAVRGERTESGLPVLAGDPHMGLNMPGFWFEAHLSAPSHQITGATIPGAPFVILGKNDHLGWTITNMMADVVDFFIETTDPDDSGRYITNSGSSPQQSEPFDYRDDLIRVQGKDDILFRVRKTRNGPVVSDLIGNDIFSHDHLITMAWTGNRVSNEGMAMYRMNRASGMEEFENAVREFKSPAMNFTYADRDNNVAIFSAAGLPQRGFNPLLFRDGSNPEYLWQADIPYNLLPRIVNPPSGFVAHANNKLHTDSYGHYIGSFWAPPSRIMRITQQLEELDSVNADQMQRLQYDSFSEHAREITEDILPVLRTGPYDFSVVLPYLENWDFLYTPSSTAASVFDLFLINLSKNTLEDDLGPEAYSALVDLGYIPVQIMSRMIRENSTFFNRTDTPETESREDIIRLSMHHTVEQLTEMFGDEPFDWRWENVNTITLSPQLLGEAARNPEAPGVFRLIVNNLFNKGPFPVHGNSMTVNKAEYNWNRPFEVTVGPSIRRIIDFGSPGRSHSVLPTGQSGNPLSTHYGDQTQMWLDGRYRYIWHDSTFFQQASFQTMRLNPGTPR